MSFIIRKGKLTDLAQVLELIHELSINAYNLKSEIDIYDLIRDGFSNKSYFGLFVAEMDGEIVGFSIYNKAYSSSGKSMIIEEAFVTSRYKNKGVGLSLFSKCLEYANSIKVEQLEWGYYEAFPSLKLLYEKAGATVLNETSIFWIGKEIINQDNNFDKINKQDNIVVRKAVKKDAYHIILLMSKSNNIKKKSANLSIDKIIKDGFSNQPLFNMFVLELDGKIIGYISFYDAYSIFDKKSLNVSDIFIKKKYKNNERSNLLFQKLINYANKNKYNRISFLVSDFDEEFIALCKELKAAKRKGVRVTRIGYEALYKFINN